MENMNPYGPSNGRMPGSCNGMLHQIKPGDTLYLIAKQYHSSIEALLHANYGIDPYNLQVGSHICIPGTQTAPMPSQPSVPAVPPAPAQPPVTDYYPTPPMMPDFFAPAPPYGAAPMVPFPDNAYMPESIYMPENVQTPNYNMPGPVEMPLYNAPDTDERPSCPIPEEMPMTSPLPMPAPIPVPVPPPAPAPKPAPNSPVCCPRGTVYTVKKEDTLTKILTAGDLCCASLLSCNPDIDLYHLSAGQQICLPEKELSSKSRANTSYTTGRSDNLSRIAESFKISTDSLLVCNQALRPSDFSQPGTRIRIPEPGTPKK